MTELNDKLKDHSKEKLKFVKKLITPRTIQKVYKILCTRCKHKAIQGREDFCDNCMQSLEELFKKKVEK